MNLPKNFPDISDEELQKFIKSTVESFHGAHSLNDVLDRTPFIQVALNELQKRTINSIADENKKTVEVLSKFYKTTEEFNKETTEQTKRVLTVSKYALMVSIIASIGVFAQIYLTNQQLQPLRNEQARNDRQAWEFCKEGGNKDQTWPTATGGEIGCEEVVDILKDKFDN